MFVGWRLGEDYELLSTMPDGTLELDLLTETAHHSAGIDPSLWISGELVAWLRHRLEVHAIPLASIRTARLVVAFGTDRITTDQKKTVSFDFSCRSTVEIDEATYTGELVEKHSYHRRLDT